MRLWSGIIITILCLLIHFNALVAAASDPAGEKTLQEVLRHTYKSNPEILSARSEVHAAQELLPQAMSGWKPSVEATADISAAELDSKPEGYDGYTSKAIALEIIQPVYRGGRTLSDSEAAGYSIRSSKAQARAIEQTVMLEAVSAYMNVIKAEAVLELRKGNRKLISRRLEATKERFRVGELTKTDVSQAEARLAQADSGVISARGDVRSAYAEFEQITGMAPQGLSKAKPFTDLPEDIDSALKLAGEINPEIKAAEYAYRASRQNIRSVYGELLPEVGLSGSWSRTRDPSPGTIEESTSGIVGLSATIPLYKSGSVRSRIREARHQANRKMIDITGTRRAVRENVINAWENLMAARAEIMSRQSQVKAAAVAKEGVNEEAKSGTRTVLDVLDADQEYLDAQVSMVTAKTNEVVAAFTLARAIGLLSPGKLGFPGEEVDFEIRLDKAKWKIPGIDVELPLGQK